MMSTEISTRNVELSETTERLIRDRAERLTTFFHRITSCRVVVERPHRHHQNGEAYLVRLDIAVPGNELVIKRKPDESLLTAIQEAFGAAQRKLQRWSARRRGAVKYHTSAQVPFVEP